MSEIDKISLAELRLKIKDKSIYKIEVFDLERVMSRLFRSKEFTDYWQSYLQIDKQAIKIAVEKHNPNPKTPVSFYCIAGGAVSNLMYAYLTETTPVLNDIDIFCWSKGPAMTHEEYYGDIIEDQIEPVSRITQAKLKKMKIEKSPRTFFTGVVREGMLNLIYQSDSQLLEKNLITLEYMKLKFNELINEFDYNATMAFWTPEVPNDFHFNKSFAFFIKENILKIFNFNNPISTIFRGIKKSEELKAKFEKNKVIEVIANLFKELNIEETHLGEKKKIEFRNNPKLLEPWFKFDEAKGILVSQLANPTFSSYTQNKSKVFAFFKLSPWQREQLLFLCDNNFFQFSDMYKFVNSCQVNIPQYNKKQVAKYKDFMARHTRIKIHPNQINEWLPFIKKCYNTRDQGVIGFIETHMNYALDQHDYDLSSFYKNPQHPPDFYQLKAKYEKELKEEFSDILTTPIAIPDKFKDSFEELISRGALKVEGLELDHCVGGYYHSVKNGRSKIFKIRHNGEKATLEVGINHQYKMPANQTAEWPLDISPVYLRQVRGIKNVQVSKELSEVVAEFIKLSEPEFIKTIEFQVNKAKDEWDDD